MTRAAAAAFVLVAISVLHGQRQAIRWESTGGPLISQQQQVLSTRGELLLIGGNGMAWRSRDQGVTWDRPAAGASRPWKIVSSGDALFGDAIDSVVTSNDSGDSWRGCGAAPVDRRAGHEVTSLAAHERRVYVSVLRVGLFRSRDGCASWTPVTVPWTQAFPPQIGFAEGSVVIVRAAGGWFFSSDEGDSWRLLGEPASLAGTFTPACRGDILAATTDGVFSSPDQGRSWNRAGLRGRAVAALTAPTCDEWLAVVGDRGRSEAFRTRNRGLEWTVANDGLSGHQIYRMASMQGRAYAVGAAGAYRWDVNQWTRIGPAAETVTSLEAAPGGGMVGTVPGFSVVRFRAGRWEPLVLTLDGQPVLNVTRVAMAPQGEMLVATHNGVIQSRDDGLTWQWTGLRRMANVFASPASGAVLAATGDGVFRSSDGGATWIERSIGLTDFNIVSLSTGADGAAYAGTHNGNVFRSNDGGDRWRVMGPTVVQYPVNALVALRTGDVLKGGEAGIVRWSQAAQSWQRPGGTGTNGPPAVRALAQDGRGAIFAGTARNGVFVSVDNGATWRPANEGLPTTAVFAITIDADGRVAAATDQGVFRISRP